MQKHKITGIAGSVRSCIRSNEFLKLLNSCKGFDQLYELIYKLGGDKKISNSESLLMAALYGAMEMGMEINHVKVDDFFSKHKSKSAILTEMAKILENTKGIIISSPVYFGDRTSLIAEWLNYMKICGSDKIPLDGLATGIVSVGAKRNGGQETTNVYALYDSLNLGACVVGNGPPTSQYGGTGVAGAIGMIIDDTFGLSTSRGTGQRVGILSKILSQDNTGYKKKVKILVIITCKDNNGKIIDRIRCLPFSQNVEVDILDITENNILRCRACPICPAGDIKKKYTCIIPPMSKSQKKGDDMKMIHDRMIRADFIIIAHANGSNTGKDNFQVFLERTRFIRRNNFELANMGFSVYAESDQLTDIFILRGMTSFLRHNVFLLGPFYSSLRTKNSLAWENINLDTFASRIEEFAIKSKLTKFDGIDTFDSSYVPIGYMES